MRDSPTPLFKEDHISQAPALQLLQNLGWTYLAPKEAVELRGDRLSRVILTGILAPKLAELNRIEFKGESVPFSEANIRTAVEALEDVPIESLVRTSEKVYDLLRLPKSLQQTVLGETRSFDLRYVDWQHPERNAYHVTEEFEVERTGSAETCRPDIVLFVNGIPVAAIECKRPDLDTPPMEQAASELIRNQRAEYIPRLFLYTQLLLAVSKNEALYATTGTPRPFWSVWREEHPDEAAVAAAVNHPLTTDQKDRLFAERFRYVRRHFDELDRSGREVTEQDRAIWALCRPERLIELMRRFILYDGGVKKIARYQQYFCVKRTMDRLSRPGPDGKRPGGVVWHTQGSGKSLTMVILATAVAEDIATTNVKKVVLVTDRVDLDKQIRDTFLRCAMEPERATTGKKLVELLQDESAPVVTTVIDKFETAVATRGFRLESPDIFVLVDESHRGQYGALHASMRRVLPNACFLGFTGTPVMKAERDTVRQFGGLIDTYTITQAVADKAVVPLLYEGRNVPQTVDREQIDRWFERITKQLTKQQAADLKRKFSSTAQLDKAEQKVAAIAWDVAAHFAATWKGTGFKGQLVTPDRATSLLYKKHLDESGLVTSEILISGPDEREGFEDIHEEPTAEVRKFWDRMMARYGDEEHYNDLLINAFKYADEPEIIIVVSKLLTGFDAPRDVVLYLARSLKDHTLLQAIARVNRVYEGKEYGYVIDYAGVLQNLEMALDLYGRLPDFDATDLEGMLTDVSAEIAKLPQRHSDLWDLFRSVKNRRDEEEFERVLGDDAVRPEFYERLSAYARNLQLALSTVTFLEKTPEAKVESYRRDLRFFAALRGSARRRYAEVVDFGEYEPRIQRLLDVHVGTGEVETLTGLVNIFDREAFAREVEKLQTAASKADTIAYRTKVTIRERMAEDPAYYQRFSDMLEAAIAESRARRLSDAEYLKRVTEISASVRDRTGDEVPEAVRAYPDARALFGVVRETVSKYQPAGPIAEEAAAATALAIDRAIEEYRTVHWTHNPDVQNQMRNAIEDELFGLKQKLGVPLALDDIDSLMERCLDVAKVRKS